jgi:HK97 family phage prohead protease
MSETEAETRLEQVKERVEAAEMLTPPRRDADFDQVEVREDNGKIEFVGHAAVFDRLSGDLGGFRERIQRGAFRKVLDKNPDVAFLFNHNKDNILARTSSGTLELREDPRGLRVYADLAPTQLAKDLRELIKRRDVQGMSFGFRMNGEEARDTWGEEEGEIVRTIHSFGDVFDVGPCTFPAYSATDASVRALVRGVEIVTSDGAVVEDDLRELAWKIHRGEVDATVEERSVLDSAFERTNTVSPWIAERAFRAASQEPELRAAIPGKRVTVNVEDDEDATGEVAHRLAAARRRLRIREMARSAPSTAIQRS